jgi:thiol-disulfide isomerase/thioredoxin
MKFMRSVAILALAAISLMAQDKIPWADAEKPIIARIQKLRDLPDAERWPETRRLALEIRQLPASPGKDTLAIDLANLTTEGDPGQETIQESATTLAEALNVQPVKDDDPYFTLAQLVRYEHAHVTCDDPRFLNALKTLEADDQRRDKLNFKLTALDGKSWTLRQLKGKVVVVNFWATWCPPCRKEMPDIDAIYKENRSKGLVILAISDEERGKVEAFLKEHPVSYTVLLDPGRKVNDLFAVRGIPKTFVYDRSGHLAAESIDMRTKSQFMTMLEKAGL